MATIKSIRQRKFAFEDHTTTHRCRIGQCDERRQLWLDYQREGEIWGGYKVDEPTAGLL